MAHLILVLLSLFVFDVAMANSCCGQSPTSYMVLYQQQKYSLSAGYSFLQTEGRVFNNEDFVVWSNDKKRSVNSLSINGASMLNEWTQLFFSTSYLSSEFVQAGQASQATHLSDTQLGLTYEVLPEYSFSYWRPQIFVSSFANLPTGYSIYDDNQLSEGTSVTGHHQWGLGVGVTLRKMIFPFALVVQGKVLSLFPKDFDQLRVSQFYDSSLASFLTYSTNFWGLGATVGMTYNSLSSRRISTSSVASQPSQVTTVLFSIQKIWSDEISVSLSYADQTLLGSPQNTLLNKSYGLNFNYNFL